MEDQYIYINESIIVICRPRRSQTDGTLMLRIIITTRRIRNFAVKIKWTPPRRAVDTFEMRACFV